MGHALSVFDTVSPWHGIQCVLLRVKVGLTLLSVCRQTIDAARGADLLIHEATFEASMVEDAQAKRHSTTVEAVDVAEKVGGAAVRVLMFCST